MVADNSEPAFPHPGGASDYTVQVSHMGMSLRDWFAGQALAGVVLEESRFGNNMYSNESVAKTSYGIADAMLAERSK